MHSLVRSLQTHILKALRSDADAWCDVNDSAKDCTSVTSNTAKADTHLCSSVSGSGASRKCAGGGMCAGILKLGQPHPAGEGAGCRKLRQPP